MYINIKSQQVTKNRPHVGRLTTASVNNTNHVYSLNSTWQKIEKFQIKIEKIKRSLCMAHRRIDA